MSPRLSERTRHNLERARDDMMINLEVGEELELIAGHRRSSRQIEAYYNPCRWRQLMAIRRRKTGA